MIDGDEPGTIVAAKHGPPLVIGLGEGENFVASDVAPLLAYTRNIIYLEDGEYAVVDDKKVELFDRDDQKIERAPKKILWDAVMAEKDGYRHFMLKEIHEQPRAVRDTFTGRMFEESGEIFFNDLQFTPDEWAKISESPHRRLRHVVALGAGRQVPARRRGAHPVEVDYGSEYRYRDPIIDEHDARHRRHAVGRDRRHDRRRCRRRRRKGRSSSPSATSSAPRPRACRTA